MTIQFCFDIEEMKRAEIQAIITEFAQLFHPIEKTLYVLEDSVTNAVFIECHILGEKIIELSTVDIPLDPESQPEYRANRDVVEDNSAFIQMKDDAIHGRSFCNIVTEYNTSFDEDKPLKIIGGQHRFHAIEEANNQSVNKLHGVKVYFALNTEQRLDAQVISNTNIAVSSDLLDRMLETVKGPELRSWCQLVGFLESDEDFSDRKQRGSKITVRAARSFIMNYYSGKKVTSEKFSEEKTAPVIAKTGGVDEDWEKLKKNNPKLWVDAGLCEAGRAFAELLKTQRDHYKGAGGKISNGDFADKASSYAVLAAWSYIAGVLQDNKVRLKKLFELPRTSKTDPLNALVLAKARHSTDPTNYRGLGTRTDVKERGRLAELFFLVAEKGDGITPNLATAAIKRYYAKQAVLEAREAESKI